MAQKTIVELQDDIDGYQKHDRELSARICELEMNIARQSEDTDAAQRHVRLLQEELAEKDGQLMVVTGSLDAVQKQNQQQMCQVQRSLMLIHRAVERLICLIALLTALIF